MTFSAFWFDGYWSVQDVQNFPNYLWLYGDNDIKQGKGGQAIIRDEPNTFGIPTKKYPDYRQESYYTDDEYVSNCIKIQHAFNEVKRRVSKYEGIVLPKAGFGTGLSGLNIQAPKTFEFLQEQVNSLIAASIQ